MPDPNAFWIVSFRPDSDDPLADIDEKLGPSGVLGKSVATLTQQSRPANGVGQLKLPEFHTAPLSTLVSLSESLAKHDTAATATLVKVIDTLQSISASALDTTSVLSSSSSSSATPSFTDTLVMDDGRRYDAYLREGWEWNKAKYRVEGRKLEELVDGIVKDFQAVETIQKNKVQAYNTSKGQLQQNIRKKTGNLSVKNLSDVVSKSDFVSNDSEYLETLLVAVPKNLTKEWFSSYERLTSMIVPRSSNQLASDSEFVLVNVTVFKKSRDEFLQKCREKKFVVREFKFDEAEIEKNRREILQVEEQEKVLGTELLRLSRINFSEAFAALVHLKVVRSYIECLLRFGLPGHFFACIVKPEPKQSKRLLASLTQYVSTLDNGVGKNEPTAKKKGGLFGSGGNNSSGGGAAVDSDVGGEYAGLLEQEVFDFVLFELGDPASDGKE